MTHNATRFDPATLASSFAIGQDPASVRARVEALERILERAFMVPGINRPIGLDAIVGLIPVVGDLIDVAVGRAALTFRALDLWPEDDPGPRLASPRQVRSRYYLRFTIADRPGVIAALTRVLGDHGISIASVIQHDPGDDAPPDAPVPLVIMTHLAIEGDLNAALRTINGLDVVHAPSVCLGVEE